MVFQVYVLRHTTIIYAFTPLKHTSLSTPIFRAEIQRIGSVDDPSPQPLFTHTNPKPLPPMEMLH